jgi:uncharacterized oligopeptide transporter (OPT) family protein
VGQLFSGIGVGLSLPLLLERLSGNAAVAWLAGTGISTSTVGAGMIVGARVAGASITYAFIWEALTPWLRANGWLGEHDPYRRFAFIVALGMIMGAAVVDIALILAQAVRRLRAAAPEAAAPEAGIEPWRQTNTKRLILWIVGWALALIVVATTVLGVSLGWVLLAMAFSVLMMLVNGISLGITDSNPISSAFVLAVVVMAAFGMKDPVTGLLAASIVLVVCSIGGDMQQDRSTGWRLGTPRVKQFRYQVIGVVVGAVMAVYMAKLFMQAYPVLRIDTFSHPEQKVAQWQSAMTYKFVGALRGLTNPQSWQVPAMLVGVGLGTLTEVVRKFVKNSARYREWAARGPGYAFDVCFDAVLVPSPYASSFAGFVEFTTAMWFGGGGVLASLWNTALARAKRAAGSDSGEALPEDMSVVSLVGGGLIAGDSIAALVLGVVGLLALMGN